MVLLELLLCGGIAQFSMLSGALAFH
jgi:hypothetical protein